MAYGLIDMGWGAWRLADPGLALTPVTQAQADALAGLEEGWEAGATDVRFGESFGDLLVVTAGGAWLMMGEDGSTEDVTSEVMS